MKFEQVIVNEFSSFSIDDLPSDLPDTYKNLLDNSNGGYVSDRYFHFFGLAGPIQHNVVLWNQSEWRDFYSLEKSWFVFAEDIFGNQFFIKRHGRKGSIYMLDCCHGRIYFMAGSYDSFVNDIVEDPIDEVISKSKKLAEKFFLTTKQRWEPFVHLSYKLPLVLGGEETDVANMELCDSLVNLTILGQIIAQTKDLKPGTVIRNIQIDRKNCTARLVF